MATADFATLGPLGANYNRRTTEAEYDVGTISFGTNNTGWVYVLASEAVATGTCTVNTSTFALTDAAGEHTADTAFASGEYGWVRATDQVIEDND
jgi:hypothetical protein